MKGKEATVSFTKNLGNFQSLRVEVTLEADNVSDTVDSLVETAAAFAREACGEALDQHEAQLLDLFRREEREMIAFSKEIRG